MQARPGGGGGAAGAALGDGRHVTVVGELARNSISAGAGVNVQVVASEHLLVLHVANHTLTV